MRGCPDGLLLTTPLGAVAFHPTAESRRSWHDGDIFAGHAPAPAASAAGSADAAADEEACAAQVVGGGLYEGEVPYGQEECSVLAELDRAPSARAGPLPPIPQPPRLRLHRGLGRPACGGAAAGRPPAPRARAAAAQPAPAGRGKGGWAGRPTAGGGKRVRGGRGIHRLQRQRRRRPRRLRVPGRPGCARRRGGALLARHSGARGRPGCAPPPSTRRPAVPPLVSLGRWRPRAATAEAREG
jgi:hypothetical protein